MFIKRKIYPKLQRHLLKKQITVLTGMRRTGKTSLIKQLLKEVDSKNKLYLDLERIDQRQLFMEKNYDNIIQSLQARDLNFKKKVYLFIDEIQLVPSITSVLKYLYDHYQIKFVVTGSSSYYLKDLFTESLAGRKKVFELFPLDFGEFLVFKNISFKRGGWLNKKFLASEYERLKKYYEEYIEHGGFPEVVLTKDKEEKVDLINDILNSYINIDIKNLADFKKDKDIYQLIKLLAGRVGSRLDYSKLSRITGLSRVTVKNYIDFFEKTYLIKRVSVYTKNPEREIVKAQKIYFCDSGMANSLFDLNSGAKFEQAVFNQLKSEDEVRYYSLKSGREIDFVLDSKIAVETKLRPTKFDLEDLKKLGNQAGLKKVKLVGKYSVPHFENYVWGGEIK